MPTNDILEFIKEEEILVGTLMWAKYNMSQEEWDVFKHGIKSSEDMNYVWGVDDLVVNFTGFLDWFDISKDLSELGSSMHNTSKY